MCKCTKAMSVPEAVDHLLAEIEEYALSPIGSPASADELSDVHFAINRLVGAVLGLPYVRHAHEDELHINKMMQRLGEHGCVRSERHLVAGRCPSE